MGLALARFGDRLTAGLRLYFLARGGRLLFHQQLQLQIAQRFTGWSQKSDALFAQPLQQLLNLSFFLLDRELSPVQFAAGSSQRRFQCRDAHLRISSSVRYSVRSQIPIMEVPVAFRAGIVRVWPHRNRVYSSAASGQPAGSQFAVDRYPVAFRYSYSRSTQT